MTAIAFTGMDEVMGFRVARALGYSPDRPGVPSRRGSTFGMIGANGSTAYADIDSGVAVAVMRNGTAQGDLTDLTAAARIDRLIPSCCREPDPQVGPPSRSTIDDDTSRSPGRVRQDSDLGRVALRRRGRNGYPLLMNGGRGADHQTRLQR